MFNVKAIIIVIIDYMLSNWIYGRIKRMIDSDGKTGRTITN